MGARSRTQRIGSIVIISAPSGSGKSTLVHALMVADRELVFSVSYTTRPRRAGEKHGRDYLFVTPARFRQMIKAGRFLEWADVHGHLYGTAREQVRRAQAAGQDILLDIDVQGHAQVRRRLPEAVSIFVLPPSFRELARRLRSRHSDAPGQIRKRLATARREIRHWREYDYVVVNDDLTRATKELRALVAATRLRRDVRRPEIQGILETFGGKKP